MPIVIYSLVSKNVASKINKVLFSGIKIILFPIRPATTKYIFKFKTSTVLYLYRYVYLLQCWIGY